LTKVGDRESLAGVEYRSLGGGLRVSALTYGNWLTSDPSAGAAAETAARCVGAALDAGITTFDTADTYGEPRYGAAEEALGLALHGTPRHAVELMTKVCMRTGPGANDRGLSRKHIMESCHASLRRLRTDYIDVYQAHRYDDDTPLDETMIAFADLVRQGKVLYVGVSEWTADQLTAGAALAAELGISLVSNQAQYSLLWRVVESDVVPVSEKLGLNQLAFATLAHGVLTGKYGPGAPPPEGSRGAGGSGARFVDRYASDAVLRAVIRLQPLAREVGLSLAQLAVAWVLDARNVASVIVGGSRPEQVAENVHAVGVRLEPGLKSAVDAALIDDEHGDLVERDPSKTARLFDVPDVWRRPADALTEKHHPLSEQKEP
jgi:aryl-alcohol dehydrogenase-like predicted oxidoreductase